MAGFGSLVVDDPKGLSQTILDAARQVQGDNQRILLSRCALVANTACWDSARDH